MVKGTHRCGRIDHCLQAGQTTADQTRVDELLKHFDHVYAEMIPGQGSAGIVRNAPYPIWKTLTPKRSPFFLWGYPF